MSKQTALDMEPMIALNMVPLIDVLLVLIVMLIVTFPRSQLIALDLSTGCGGPPIDEPLVVSLDIDFDGTLSWDGASIRDRAGLESKFAALAAEKAPTELHIRANQLAPYRTVAAALTAAQRAGVRQIGMVDNEQFL